jgi:hypothetical protein
MRVRFEVLARYFGLRLSLDASYEFIDVGVVGTQHGEVVSLTDRNPGFLEFHFDSGRCSPDSERQDVTPAIAAHDLERWRRVREFRMSRYGGDPPVRAAVTEQYPSQRRAGISRAAVFARVR